MPFNLPPLARPKIAEGFLLSYPIILDIGSFLCYIRLVGTLKCRSLNMGCPLGASLGLCLKGNPYLYSYSYSPRSKYAPRYQFLHHGYCDDAVPSVWLDHSRQRHERVPGPIRQPTVGGRRYWLCLYNCHLARFGGLGLDRGLYLRCRLPSGSDLLWTFGYRRLLGCWTGFAGLGSYEHNESVGNCVHGHRCRNRANPLKKHHLQRLRIGPTVLPPSPMPGTR